MDLSPGISYFLGQLSRALLDPGSHASLLSLAGAFLIAFALLTLRSLRKGRRVRVKALLRALFPRHIVSSKSSLADLSYFYFNVLSVWPRLWLGAAVIRNGEPLGRATADGSFRAAAADGAAALHLSHRMLLVVGGVALLLWAY